MPRPFRFALSFYLFAFVSVLASAAPWLAVDSDLPPDPGVRWGALPNGLRYAILPNAEPKNRVSLRLLVSVGSLHERDDERGMAHFVEHMAFRGTRRHPGDSLAQELARLGIGFGPDNTAFTSFNFTVYHLELPDAGEAMLRRGLDVFREYAGDLSFERALVERERGVILSEKAMRDTPSARFNLVNQGFLWPNARETKRQPIGLETAVQKFSRQQLVDFYDAWYRPERLAVVVVGNVTTEAVEQLIAATFGSLTARALAREEPADLLTATSSKPTINGWLDKDLAGIEIALEHPLAEPRAPDTAARRANALQRTLAMMIVQQRLSRLAHVEGGAVVVPSATIDAPIPGWTLATLSATGRMDDWERLAAAIEQEHRRAFLHGFTSEEVDAARATLRMSYEQNARSAATRRSEQLAGNLEGSMLYGQVFATPATVRDDALAALSAANPQNCLDAFRTLWGHESLHVFVGSSPAFNIRRADIARVLNASRTVKVDPPLKRPPLTFAYAINDPPATLVRDEIVSDLDIRLAEFSNGVRLNFKSTTFEADYVNITVRVGSGQLSQPRERPGLDLLATYTLIRGGLRRHSQDELRELLSSHALQINFQVQPDAFVFYGRCARSELPFCLQVITAYLNDAAYRPEALREAQADFGSMFMNLAASASGPTTVKAERTLVDDVRFGYPTNGELSDRTLNQVTVWLEPQFKQGPVEVGIVGDVSWADASVAVAASLGTLSPRGERPDLSESAHVRFRTPAKTPYVGSSVPHLKQASIAWFWPVPDATTTQQERRCWLLAELLTERFRLRLREQLGAAYAPSASFVQREGFPGFSYFGVYAEIAREQVVPAAEAIRREIDAIRSRGFKEDDFLRVKQPFLRSREDDLRSNAYWSYIVLHDAQQRPERLVAARNRTADSAAITRKELERLAKRYLDPAQGFMFVAEPGRPHLWKQK